MSTPPPPRRLERRVDDRVLAGVAAGIAEHLRVDVRTVRLAFVVLAAAGGAGVLMYAALWAFVPQRVDQAPRRIDVPRFVAYAAAAVAVAVVTHLFGGGSSTTVWPVVVAAAGGALIWRQADEAQRRQWLARVGMQPARPGRRWSRLADTRAGVVRLVVGALLVIGGLAGFLAANDALRQAQQGILAIIAVVLGLVMVTGPWWMRMAGDLAAERRERIRSEERAEIASRIHDSVLHTLTLIQRSADDPREVVRLARSQERDLRSWLYRTEPQQPDERFAAAAERAAAEVEELYGIPIEVVAVGDADLDDTLRGLLQAAREAMVNAAKSSGAATVSVYAEVEPDRVSVFVRDRGRGFDLATVGADRYGIRESIVGRMARHGGTADVRTAPGEGTEVRLSVGRQPVGRPA